MDLVRRAEDGELMEAVGSTDGVRRGVEEELPARDLRGIVAGWLVRVS